jgi:ABC-type nitrate/sulfonate/bicarbonate transport system permease component
MSTKMRMSVRMNDKTRDRLLGIGSPLVLLLLWEASARSGLIDVRFFPAPSSIAAQAVELTGTGELWGHLAASLKRLAWGTLLGGIPALLLGITMGLYRPIRAAIDPLISATYPVPKSAILPLILLIFGLDEASKIVMVALGVFFPVLINTITGVLQIDKIYLDVGKNFRATRWQTFRTVALPGAMPSIMAGIKLGIGMGLILIAIAEMVGAKNGIGFMIWDAWQILSVETMYVGLIVISILGFLLTLILNEIEGWILPWKQER